MFLNLRFLFVFDIVMLTPMESSPNVVSQLSLKGKVAVGKYDGYLAYWLN